MRLTAPGRAAPALLLALLCSPVAAQNAIWGTRFGGSNTGEGTDLAVVPGGGGDFYVGGFSYTFSSEHVFDVDASGTPTVTLPGIVNNREEPFVARFDQDGNLQWAALGTCAGRGERMHALGVFDSGSVVGVGVQARNNFVTDRSMTWNTTRGQLPRVIPASASESAPFMIRFAGDGTIRMARRLVESGFGGDAALDVATIQPPSGTANDRSFVVAGSHRGGTFGDANDPNRVTIPIGSTIGIGSSDAYLSCHEPDGNLRWVRTVGGTAGDNLVAVLAVPDGEGNDAHTDLVIAGNLGRRDATTVGFFPDSSGVPLYTLPIEPSGAESKFIARLDFSGNPSMHTPDFEIQWLLTFGGPGGSTSQARELVIDPAGQLYASGPVGADPETFPGSGVRVPTPYTVRQFTNGAVTGTSNGQFTIGGRSRPILFGLDPEEGAVRWDATVDTGFGNEVSRIAPQANGVLWLTRLNANGQPIVGTRGSTPFPPGFSSTRTWRIPFDWDGNVADTEIRTDSTQSTAVGWAPMEPQGNTPPSGRLFVTGTGQPANRLDDGQPTQIDLQIPGAPNMRVYIGAFEAEAPAAAEPFGAGCSANPSLPLALEAADRTLPVIDQTNRLRVRNAGTNAVAVNVIGFSNTLFGSLSLPFDLGLIGAPSCAQRVSLDVDLPLTVDGDGVATLDLSIPDDLIFVGNSLYLQAVVLNPAANQLGAITSNGLRLRIGG